jgi:CRP/FNR family cyclic AMP-dependent transcriptional regulator
MDANRPLNGVRYIRNSSCFSEVNFLKLKQIMYTYKMTLSNPVYREGDLADKLYFIHKGKTKITKVSEDGKEYIMYLFHEGDFLGQFDPYHDSKQSFHAYAVENCEIGIIQKGDLKVLLWQHRDLSVEFMKWMGLCIV